MQKGFTYILEGTDFNFEALKHWLRLDLAPKLLGVVKGLLRHFFPQHTASKHGLFDNQPKLVEVSRRRRVGAATS